MPILSKSLTKDNYIYNHLLTVDDCEILGDSFNEFSILGIAIQRPSLAFVFPANF